MKIRIRGNSVRFRLTKSEVHRLCEEGIIEEKTEFNESSFIYSVKASAQHDNLYASFFEGAIVLYIPNLLLKNWNVNDKVGFYNTRKLKNGKDLMLTLEKDFVCMDETVEDQSDNYPNPKMMNDKSS